MCLWLSTLPGHSRCQRLVDLPLLSDVAGDYGRQQSVFVVDWGTCPFAHGRRLCPETVDVSGGLPCLSFRVWLATLRGNSLGSCWVGVSVPLLFPSACGCRLCLETVDAGGWLPCLSFRARLATLPGNNLFSRRIGVPVPLPAAVDFARKQLMPVIGRLACPSGRGWRLCPATICVPGGFVCLSLCLWLSGLVALLVFSARQTALPANILCSW